MNVHLNTTWCRHDVFHGFLTPDTGRGFYNSMNTRQIFTQENNRNGSDMKTLDSYCWMKPGLVVWWDSGVMMSGFSSFQSAPVENGHMTNVLVEVFRTLRSCWVCIMSPNPVWLLKMESLMSWKSLYCWSFMCSVQDCSRVGFYLPQLRRIGRAGSRVQRDVCAVHFSQHLPSSPQCFHQFSVFMCLTCFMFCSVSSFFSSPVYTFIILTSSLQDMVTKYQKRKNKTWETSFVLVFNLTGNDAAVFIWFKHKRRGMVSSLHCCLCSLTETAGDECNASWTVLKFPVTHLPPLSLHVFFTHWAAWTSQLIKHSRVKPLECFPGICCCFTNIILFGCFLDFMF